MKGWWGIERDAIIERTKIIGAVTPGKTKTKRK